MTQAPSAAALQTRGGGSSRWPNRSEELAEDGLSRSLSDAISGPRSDPMGQDGDGQGVDLLGPSARAREARYSASAPRGLTPRRMLGSVRVRRTICRT